MRSTIFILVVLAFLVAVSETKKFGKKCKKTTVTCPCGRYGQNVTVPLQMCTVKDPASGAKTCELCNKNLMEGDICSRFDNCETCVKGHTVCATCPPDASGDYCTDKKSRDQGIIVYPIVVRTPRGVSMDEFVKHDAGNRFVRRAQTCRYPLVLNTAEIECKIWPKKIICKEYCLFGYTFPNNTIREQSCNFDEDKWTPTAFEECEPFVDCTTSLTSGGHLNCTANKLHRGNMCQIACKAGGEGQEATPMRNHECDINGKWNPKLPFCAKHGTGLKLVSRPPQFQRAKEF